MSWLWTVVYLVISVISLPPGSIITASGQGQMAEVKVLERDDDWQCPSMKERERARNEIHKIVESAIAGTAMTTTPTEATASTTVPTTYTCNGTPCRMEACYFHQHD